LGRKRIFDCHAAWRRTAISPSVPAFPINALNLASKQSIPFGVLHAIYLTRIHIRGRELVRRGIAEHVMEREIELREAYDYRLPIQRPCFPGDKFVYIDFINDEPFYVGMGNWGRVTNPARNDYHLRMLYNRDSNRDSKDRWIRRVVAKNLSTDGALNLEHTLILLYGRKDIGTGVLLNKNNGTGFKLENTPALPAKTPPHIIRFLLIIGALVLVLAALSPTVKQSVSPSLRGVATAGMPTPSDGPTEKEKAANWKRIEDMRAGRLVEAMPNPTPALIVPSTPNHPQNFGEHNARKKAGKAKAGSALWPDGRVIAHPESAVETYVVNVAQGDTLKLRIGLGTRFNTVAEIPADAHDILAFDDDQVWDGDTYWVPVEWHGVRGYVGRSYLPK